jgi:hypothetical protein
MFSVEFTFKEAEMLIDRFRVVFINPQPRQIL